LKIVGEGKGKEDLMMYIKFNYPGVEISETETSVSYSLSENITENIVRNYFYFLSIYLKLSKTTMLLRI